MRCSVLLWFDATELLHIFRTDVGMYDIRPKPSLSSYLAKSRLPITYCSILKPFWNFAQSMAVSVLCASVEKDLTIETSVLNKQDFARF